MVRCVFFLLRSWLPLLISTREVMSAKLASAVESQWPHLWEIQQVEMNWNFPLMTW